MRINRSRSIVIIILIVAAIIAGLSIFHSSAQLFVAIVNVVHKQEDRLSDINSTRMSHSSPNVILPSSVVFPDDATDCETVTFMNMKYPICLYTDSVDDRISARIRRGVYYEGDHVRRFLRLFLADHRLQFVDIGANIGVWSLPAARLTQVVSVEPNWRSMARLSKAVDLGSVSSNITLIHNAVSDVRASLNVAVTDKVRPYVRYVRYFSDNVHVRYAYVILPYVDLRMTKINYV